MERVKKKYIIIIACVIALIISAGSIFHYIEKKKEIIPKGVYYLYEDGEIKSTAYELCWRVYSNVEFLYDEWFEITINIDDDNHVVGEFVDDGVSFNFMYDKKTGILSVLLPKEDYSYYKCYNCFENCNLDYMWVNYKKK